MTTDLAFLLSATIAPPGGTSALSLVATVASAADPVPAPATPTFAPGAKMPTKFQAALAAQVQNLSLTAQPVPITPVLAANFAITPAVNGITAQSETPAAPAIVAPTAALALAPVPVDPSPVRPLAVAVLGLND